MQRKATKFAVRDSANTLDSQPELLNPNSNYFVLDFASVLNKLNFNHVFFQIDCSLNRPICP